MRAEVSICLLVAAACGSRASGVDAAAGPGDAGVDAFVCEGVWLAPGDDVDAAAAAHPPGTTFCLAAGIYRGQSITPQTDQVFIGAPGAILSGATVLAAFERDGAAWFAADQPQEGPRAGTVEDGTCRAGHVRCGYPEDLFFDDVPLLHVGSLADGGPGRWYFDYAADRIYLWDDPAGHTVETSVTPYAFQSRPERPMGERVIVRTLMIEKYATPTQEAAVPISHGGLVEGSEIRLNHSAGIGSGEESIARGNHVHDNGCFGFIGAGHGIVVENNQVAYNGYAGYNPFWGAGGSKWVYTDGLVVRGNSSHHNRGPGFWTDINNINTTYEDNLVEDNERGGIFHEISYDAVIRNNRLHRNGTGRDFPYWTTGAGIEVTSSSNVEVHGNTLVDNWQGITGLEDHRGTGNHGPWTLVNLNVHDNDITAGLGVAGGERTGVIDTAGTAAFSVEANNRYARNTYHLGANAQYFIWVNGDCTFAEWQGFGQDP